MTSAYGTAITNTIAQVGGYGQVFNRPSQSAYAYSVADPNKNYAFSLVGSAINVADALLWPRAQILGSSVLGANYTAAVGADVSAQLETYTASADFDVSGRGDLLLGLIEYQESGFASGSGFQSIEFSVNIDGRTAVDETFTELSAADSFFQDHVIDFGPLSGRTDLEVAYTLIASGPGGFGFDLALGASAPETSTWVLLLIGFAGMGGYGHWYRARAKAA